jgi:hypothetical protein
MRTRQRALELPREVIVLTTYAQLHLYLEKFSAGELGLVLLLGRHGTGKSEGVRRALQLSSSKERSDRPEGKQVLYVDGHMQPFGLYRNLWEHRNQSVVLDDLDRVVSVKMRTLDSRQC